MRIIARILVGLCSMALIAGQELRREAHVPIKSVPINLVDPSLCVASGGTAAVTEHADLPGVYSVRCGDGVVLVAGPR